MKYEKTCGAAVYKIWNNALCFLSQAYMALSHTSIPKLAGHKK